MKKFPDKAEVKAMLDWALLEQNDGRAWKRFMTAMSTYSIEAQIAAAKFVELMMEEKDVDCNVAN